MQIPPAVTSLHSFCCDLCGGHSVVYLCNIGVHVAHWLTPASDERVRCVFAVVVKAWDQSLRHVSGTKCSSLVLMCWKLHLQGNVLDERVGSIENGIGRMTISQRFQEPRGQTLSIWKRPYALTGRWHWAFRRGVMHDLQVMWWDESRALWSSNVQQTWASGELKSFWIKFTSYLYMFLFLVWTIHQFTFFQRHDDLILGQFYWYLFPCHLCWLCSKNNDF